jgi:hypothetical protein
VLNAIIDAGLGVLVTGDVCRWRKPRVLLERVLRRVVLVAHVWIGSQTETRECRLSLRVFGRLPVTGVTGCTEAGVGKAWKEETAAGFCGSGAVGLWGFSARV